MVNGTMACLEEYQENGLCGRPNEIHRINSILKSRSEIVSLLFIIIINKGRPAIITIKSLSVFVTEPQWQITFIIDVQEGTEIPCGKITDTLTLTLPMLRLLLSNAQEREDF